MLAPGSGYATAHGTAAVRALQRRLNGLAYAPGPVDGRYGPLTEAAVRRFQATHGLVVDGIDGPLTKAALASARLVLRPGDGYVRGGSGQVKALQRHLAAAGFPPGPIDGRYGPATEGAVTRFQATRRLTVDGIAGPKTLGGLEAAARRQAHRQPGSAPSPAHRTPPPTQRRTPAGRTPKPRVSQPSGGSLPLWIIALACLILVLMPGLAWEAHRSRAARRRRASPLVGRTGARPAEGERSPAAPEHTAAVASRARTRAQPNLQDPRHGAGAFKLGQQLAAAGDRTGAAEAFRRADERGHPTAAYELGVLLANEGDLAGAAEAFSRAEQHGHPAGAFCLGVLLAQQGDRVGAERAFREADRRGHAGAAYNLGVLLLEGGQQADAADAFRRADEGGNADAAFNRGVLLLNAGDVAGAENAFRRADGRGDAAAAFNLGVLLEQRGDLPDARMAYQRASERGYPAAAWNLALLLDKQGDHAEAQRAFERATELGPPEETEFAHAARRELHAEGEDGP